MTKNDRIENSRRIDPEHIVGTQTVQTLQATTQERRTRLKKIRDQRHQGKEPWKRPKTREKRNKQKMREVQYIY